MGKRALDKAKQNKFDEFYTQLTDIEKELKHYEKQFEGKVVYCNCDTDNSNFVKYFKDNFYRLKLKKLLYSGYPKTDFRSPESIELLKEADIVVTNPPFSLFREYVAQLVEYDKKFIVLGNLNAITYKEIFKLIKDNKLWLGVSIKGGGVKFIKPDNTLIELGCIRWYTNLPHTCKGKVGTNQFEILGIDRYIENNPVNNSIVKYDPVKYPKFDNYDAINVDRVKDIPMDYDGYMGVPITFLDKYDPKQFEILYLASEQINGIEKYARIIIKKRIQYEP